MIIQKLFWFFMYNRGHKISLITKYLVAKLCLVSSKVNHPLGFKSERDHAWRFFISHFTVYKTVQEVLNNRVFLQVSLLYQIEVSIEFL